MVVNSAGTMQASVLGRADATSGHGVPERVTAVVERCSRFSPSKSNIVPPAREPTGLRAGGAQLTRYVSIRGGEIARRCCRCTCTVYGAAVPCGAGVGSITG